jgi:hypothetical protein
VPVPPDTLAAPPARTFPPLGCPGPLPTRAGLASWVWTRHPAPAAQAGCSWSNSARSCARGLVIHG